MLVFLSLILSFIYYKKPTTNYLNLFFFSLFFVVIVYILIGLTTPVFGAIVRYKVPALPFVLIMFLTIIDINRIKLKMKFLNRIL